MGRRPTRGGGDDLRRQVNDRQREAVKLRGQKGGAAKAASVAPAGASVVVGATINERALGLTWLFALPVVPWSVVARWRAANCCCNAANSCRAFLASAFPFAP